MCGLGSNTSWISAPNSIDGLCYLRQMLEHAYSQDYMNMNIQDHCVHAELKDLELPTALMGRNQRFPLGLHFACIQRHSVW